MRISDWSSDVCSSDLQLLAVRRTPPSYLRVPRSNLSLNQRKKRASGPSPSLLPGSRGLRIVAHSAGARISATSSASGIDETMVSGDRTSGVEGKGVAVCVDLGVHRIIQKKKTNT